MEQERSPVDIRRYAVLLLRWLWLIILCTLLAAGVAFVASKLSTPIYEASATLLISEGQRASEQNYDSLLTGERLAQTYAQLLREPPVLQEAGTRLGVPLAEPGQAANVTVTPVRDTQLLRLIVHNADPALAAAIANTIPAVFIAQTEASRAQRFGSSQESLRAEMQSQQGEMAATQRALDAERASGTANGGEVARLEALLAQHRSTYAGLLQSYEEARLAEARAASTVTVFTPASVPREPVLPRTLVNTLLAGVLGAMLGVGVALLAEYVDDTVKRASDVERAVGLPTLATVFRFDAAHLNGKGPLLLAEPQSVAAEAYRLLRTNLQFATLNGDGCAPALLVTSAQPQAGKSTTVANLGVSLAQIGKRVLLVDCDLRHPTLHRHFRLDNHIGLTTLLLRPELGLEQVRQEAAVPGLYVITSGPVPANPAEVIGSPRATALLERLREGVEYVLLDSPPVLSAADASILARRADGVLLVAEPGRTRAEVLRSAVATLRWVQARIVGVVLNRAAADRVSGYAYYGYYGRDGEDGARQGRRKHSAGASTPRLLQVAAVLVAAYVLLAVLAFVVYSHAGGSSRLGPPAPALPASIPRAATWAGSDGHSLAPGRSLGPRPASTGAASEPTAERAAKAAPAVRASLLEAQGAGGRLPLRAEREHAPGEAAPLAGG